MTDITWAIVGFVIMVLGLGIGVVRPWLQEKLKPEQLILLQ
jgi:hypothetical protein